jgi:hypothetical protein
MTIETDPIYPHGHRERHSSRGVDGFLLALQYQNPASLGKALSALRGEIYWLPAENDRATIWLSEEAARNLPHSLVERLAYLAEFEVAETTRPCDKCKENNVLYACGKFGYPLRLLCLECSRFGSATNPKAIAAREEAVQHKNVLLKFRPIRKLPKQGYNLLKAA